VQIVHFILFLRQKEKQGLSVGIPANRTSADVRLKRR